MLMAVEAVSRNSGDCAVPDPCLRDLHEIRGSLKLAGSRLGAAGGDCKSVVLDWKLATLRKEGSSTK